jgi:Tfp pilus assembly protein PilF
VSFTWTKAVGIAHPTGMERILVTLVWLCVGAVGCAGWKERLTDKGVSETREERVAEAIRNFEQQRDAAQYQAALDRWRQGDAARAESQMAALVARRPEMPEARLRLAEILSARGETSAEEHFRAVRTDARRTGPPR